MAIPPTGSAHPTPNPAPYVQAKGEEAVAQPAPTESPTTVANTSALQQATAVSNPAAAAGLTQTQAETARVVLKGSPHPGSQ